MNRQPGISSQSKMEAIMKRLSRTAATFSIVVGLMVLLAWKLSIVAWRMELRGEVHS